ncbi:5'-methylthioadenosine/S-adenosylhomocysteine nucleosidase [Corallococcus sp. M7]
MPSPTKKLEELLLLLFNGNEFRRFLKDTTATEPIVRELPGLVSSDAELTAQATELLARHGLITPALFQSLADARPARAAEIYNTGESMLSAPTKKDTGFGSKRASVKIGIIAALPKEFAAVECMFESHSRWTADGRGAGRTYSLGEIPASGGGTHIVALGLLADMGNNNASVRAAQLLEHFPEVRHIVMCGIAGGIPNIEAPEEHVHFGDIVISDRNGVVQYDFIKKKGPRRFEYRHPPRPPDAELLEAVSLLKVEELKGYRPWEAFVGRTELLEGAARPADNVDARGNPIQHPPNSRRREGKPMVFHGPIASANQLLKDPTARDSIKKNFGVRAVEMESSGIADASWISGRAGYLVVRGICDYCDEKKGDVWQGYAAAAAAAYVRALIESISLAL